MTKRERLKTSLSHKQPDRIPVDMGSTSVTGIHILIVDKLRQYYGLERRPVQLVEPYQMLGMIDDDLAEVLHIDTVGIYPRNNMFGFPNEDWKEFRTRWGQVILVPGKFNIATDNEGDFLIFPEGDMTAPPSAKMPKSGYFFDTIIRQPEIIEEKLDPEENLEEFKHLSEADLQHCKAQAQEAGEKNRGVVANIGGTAVGDIALVPGPFMKHPKGIRDIAEWYMSTVMRPDYLKYVFEKQTDIAVDNLRMLHETISDGIDVLFICGTDFGTQNSSFCSVETFKNLYMPFYQKMNNWIHEHTTWKTFKHSCGAVEPFMNSFIEAGFDIINPVQINASGMDPKTLKEKYGKNIVFWGGGVDTQKILPFGKTADVEKEVMELCDIFSKDGGFVFNTVHNIQANVPLENVIAMFNALERVNSSRSA
jgi:hypothetical protein